MDVVSSKAGDVYAIEMDIILINNKDSRRRIFCLKSGKLEDRCYVFKNWSIRRR